MARVFSDLSAAGPAFVDLVLLFLLPPLLEYACRLHRRGCSCLHARFRCEGSSFGGVDGSAADHSQLACDCHRMFFRVEGEEDAADRFGAPWNRRMAMLDRLRAYYTGQMRSTATLGRADPRTWVCQREADGEIQLTTREGSRDNFNGTEITRTLRPYVEENTTSRKRSTKNAHRTMSHRLILTGNDVELYTSTSCPDGPYRLPSTGNGQYSRSNELVLRLCMDMARHDELDQDYPLRISTDHGNYDWSQRSLWFTTGDLDFDELLSEHWSRPQWRGYYSSGEILVQDVDLHDWREQSCIDSTGTVSELHDDGSCCLGQSSACSDTDIDLHCNETLTTSTSLVNYVLPWAADSGTGASSSTQLDDNSSDDDASSSTAEQPDGSCDDMDDRDDMDSSITTEELLVRQRETDVSVAAPEAPHNNDGTRSTPWWLIPGFRFLPTDREIVLFYLKQKVLNLRLPAHHTVEEGHNVYALDADDITLHGINGDDERLGFFFVHKQQDAYTYRNGCYYPTPDGYWRIRGRPACVRRRGRTVAFKTAMDFYRGRPPHGCRTPWSMFEYALNACQADLRNFEQPWMNAYVVCKVRRRESKTSAREKKRWRRPGLLPRRPSLKKVSPRRFRPEMIVLPNADVAPKRIQEQVLDPQGVVDEEPGVTGKSKRSDMF